MGGAPRLSVVIPHLEDHEALRRCLASLAHQQPTTPPFEIIVVDNGSTHPPEAICAEHEAARLLTHDTPGPGPARSHGARQAEGEILAFLDADCVAAPDWLETIAVTFADRPDPLVVGGAVDISFADPARPTAVEAYECVFGYRMKLYVERDGYTATLNMATRRSTFLDIGDFGGIDRAEDGDWGRRAQARGVAIEYVPQMRVATTARRSFEELTRKWDRHIAHDYAAVEGGRARFRWLVRAAALLGSPVIDVVRVARAPQLRGIPARLRALGCLVRIRSYRAWRMTALVFGGGTEELTASWRDRTER